MEYRRLGRTGLQVSEVGFGAWGIGKSMWRGGEDSESLRALHTARDLGVNFFDTALVYGAGHSEKLVGQFRKERTEEVIIASKVPPKNDLWPAQRGTRLVDCFPYDHIIGKTEQSLKNLGVERIDLQQFHVWTDEWVDEPEWFDAISKLKESGKIRHFGISINDHQPESALKIGASGKVDVFQVIYNIFDQSPEEELFPLSLQKDIGVIVRVPFDEGALTGAIGPDTTFPERDWRRHYFKGDRKQQVFERVERLTPLLNDHTRDADQYPCPVQLRGLRSKKAEPGTPGRSPQRGLDEELLRLLTPPHHITAPPHFWNASNPGKL
jgi:aryl-alcohol dehydrogenase-like predicted oxidoreductase